MKTRRSYFWAVCAVACVSLASCSDDAKQGDHPLVCEDGYEICGNIRESYIDGVWNKETENEWLTEIQIPVK